MTSGGGKAGGVESLSELRQLEEWARNEVTRWDDRSGGYTPPIVQIAQTALRIVTDLAACRAEAERLQGIVDESLGPDGENFWGRLLTTGAERDSLRAEVGVLREALAAITREDPFNESLYHSIMEIANHALSSTPLSVDALRTAFDRTEKPHGLTRDNP